MCWIKSSNYCKPQVCKWIHGKWKLVVLHSSKHHDCVGKKGQETVSHYLIIYAFIICLVCIFLWAPTEDYITKRFSIICNFKEHKWYAIIYNVRKIMTITILSPERFTFSCNFLLESLRQASLIVFWGSWVEKGQASYYSSKNMSAFCWLHMFYAHTL